MSSEEVELMKKKIVEKRKELHEKNEIEVGKRWSFEEAVSIVKLIFKGKQEKLMQKKHAKLHRNTFFFHLTMSVYDHLHAVSLC